MKESHTKNANVQRIDNGWKLKIERGDATQYRDAQLDDYSSLPRYKFPHRSLSLSLVARASSDSIPGTWGFGLWNDPFGLSLGFGGNPFRLPMLPNAVWFFNASPHNYLSFRDDKPARGFLAQSFRSPIFHPLLIPAALSFPFSRKATRKLLGRIIAEDGGKLDVDVTQRHKYQIEWSPNRVLFWVDDMRVLESSVSPHPPLGIIIWIDNQFAAFTPEGKLSAGVLSNEESWIEVEDMAIKK